MEAKLRGILDSIRDNSREKEHQIVHIAPKRPSYLSLHDQDGLPREKSGLHVESGS